MHEYSISTNNKNTKKKITSILICISIILTYVLNVLLENLVVSISIHNENIIELFMILGKIGIFQTPLTFISVYVVVAYLFNHHFWKLKSISTILGIPNLEGEWEGELVSSFLVTETKHTEVLEQKMRIRMNMSVQQNYDTILVISKFPNSISDSYLMRIEVKSMKLIIVEFVYKNVTFNQIGSESNNHAGFNRVFFDLEKGSACGTYLSERGIESKSWGNFNLEKIN